MNVKAAFMALHSKMKKEGYVYIAHTEKKHIGMDNVYHAKIKLKGVWKKVKRVAEFYKVSFEQFEKDYRDCFTPSYYDDYDEEEMTSEEIRKIWESIELPKRSTSGSAGYDFVTPVPIALLPEGRTKIPTGIRCRIDNGWVLKLYVRSSVGFKYEVCLTNGTGIIDSDYFNADNEGHIFVKLRNDGTKNYIAEAGDKFVQGIFCKYGITVNDDTDDKRTGGIGSTGR